MRFLDTASFLHVYARRRGLSIASQVVEESIRIAIGKPSNITSRLLHNKLSHEVLQKCNKYTREAKYRIQFPRLGSQKGYQDGYSLST